MRRAQGLYVLIFVLGGLLPLRADAAQRLNIQSRSCLGWDVSLHRLLEMSEQFAIHSHELRVAVRSEAKLLKERCLRDISQASVNRYVLLTKMLFDDEADEVESF
jgi:hypothetical protein